MNEYASHRSGRDRPTSTRLEQVLRRIVDARTNLGAVVAVDQEGAAAAAQECDRAISDGGDLGPLHGALVMVKDNIDVAGLATTDGSLARDGVPRVHDAEVVTRLRSAGAVIVGKTAMDELALGVTGTSPRFPPCRNAWDVERLPGGSSGGSAVAVAANLADFTLGTDTGGSIRTPSAMNGVSGLRPTPGTCSMSGVSALSPSFDTVGPIAGDVGMLRKVLEVLADDGVLGASEHVGGPRPMVLGVPRAMYTLIADLGVVRVFEDALAALEESGFDVVEIDLPGVGAARAQFSSLMLFEAFHTLQPVIQESAAVIGPAVLERLMLGGGVSTVQHAEASHWASEWTNLVNETVTQLDAIVIPTVPCVAQPHVGPMDLAATSKVTSFTIPWSLARVPAVSIPCGLDQGLPVGMQLVGATHRDLDLLDCAAQIQSTTQWHRQHPGSRARSRAQT